MACLRSPAPVARRALPLLALPVLALAACGSNPIVVDAGPDLTVPSGTMGGPVSGAADTHCTGDGGKITQETHQAACMEKPDGGMADTVYPPTHYNAESDDDDCKYHVKWTSAGVYKNYPATFTVTLTRTVDGKVANGADTQIEAFLDDTHPAPNADTKTTETSPGIYTIGPVMFDKSGRWTVRFHFYEECYDYAEDSPHGHAAFFVDVP
jgi:hypothetical protein